MVPNPTAANRSGFKHFFIRGLAIVLPSVLTLWILFTAYAFVQVRIATPINEGVRWTVLSFTDFPVATEANIEDFRRSVLQSADLQTAFRQAERADRGEQWLERQTRERLLLAWWHEGYRGVALNQIGLVIAIVLIYLAGRVLTSFIGRRLVNLGESIMLRVPVFKQIYPAVKQVTEFIVGGDDPAARFSRVVAVEFPRRESWVIGFVTGETMRPIQEHLGEPMHSVFIPNTPTPLTGFVIMVAKKETIDLPMSIDDAIKFMVSAGVVVPPAHMMPVRQRPKVDGKDQGSDIARAS